MDKLCGCEPEHSYYCATCYSELENRLAESEKEKNWYKQELERVAEIALKNNSQLVKSIDVLREAASLISSTSYTVENGKRCMDGNEYVWIDRALSQMKGFLENINEKIKEKK